MNAQDTETIRASLIDGDTEEADDPSPPAVSRDDVARMNRGAVQAFLRERDVTVRPDATLADLRALAVEALGS